MGMNGRLAAIALLAILILPLASAISMIRPQDRSLLLLAGEQELVQFTIRGDALNNTIEVFAKTNSSRITVDGKSEMRKNYTLDEFEDVNTDFIVRGVSAGEAEIEYGVRVIANSSSAVVIEQVLRGKLSTIVLTVSNTSNPVNLPRPPRTSSSAGGGGGGVPAAGTTPEPTTTTATPESTTIAFQSQDTSMDSITSSSGSVNEMQIDSGVQQPIQMPVLAISESGSAPTNNDKKQVLFVLLASSFGTVVLGITTFVVWRGTYK